MGEAIRAALLLEDSEDQAVYERAILEQLGYVVTTAGTIAEARALLTDPAAWSLAVLDVYLPDGVAVDLARELVGTVPTVLISTYEPPDIPGDLVYEDKPVGRERMRGLVSRARRQRRGGGL